MTKPRRGDCGGCHWFELAPGQQGGIRTGFCMANPPVAAPSVQPHPVMQGQGRMVLQGFRPPVAETDRCEKWRTAGAIPGTARERIAGMLAVAQDDGGCDAN